MFMNRKEMLELLKSGMKPIDVEIKKWKDGIDEHDWSSLCGADNCALCEVTRSNVGRIDCRGCVLSEIGEVCGRGSVYDVFLHLGGSESDVVEAAYDMLKVLEHAKKYLIESGRY